MTEEKEKNALQGVTLKVASVTPERISEIAQNARRIREELQTRIEQSSSLSEKDLHVRIGS